MKKGREQLLAWLSDAHAMEVGMVPILENHARDAQRRPEVSARIEAHARETREHAELIGNCIRKLGGQLTAKSTLSAVIGQVEAFGTAIFADEQVKNALMDYAAEHFEIAAYRALIAAAGELGEHEVSQTCTRILEQEEAMAAFLSDQIAPTVRVTLRGVAG